MRKLVGTCALIAAAGFVTPGLVQAQTRVGPMAAFHDDWDFGIGAFVMAAMPEWHENVSMGGDFVIYFPDGPVDYFELNGNVYYTFTQANPDIAPWVFAGLSLARASFDELGPNASDTDLGLNLGGGVTFNPTARVSPIAGGKIELSGGQGFVIFGGVAFTMGS